MSCNEGIDHDSPERLFEDLPLGECNVRLKYSRRHPAFTFTSSVRGKMSHLMKLAETLRDIAEESSKSEIEQALGLCMGFADRVSREREDAPEDPESLGQSLTTRFPSLPN